MAFSPDYNATPDNTDCNPGIMLRAVEPTDADFMYEVDNDTEAWAYSDTIAPLSRQILRNYAIDYDPNPFSSGQIRFIIAFSATGEPVGILDLYDISPVNRHACIGIYILEQNRGLGLACEAIRKVGVYARDVLHLHSLFAKVKENNTASVNLFEKSGFSLVATIPEWFASKSGYSSLLVFSNILGTSDQNK